MQNAIQSYTVPKPANENPMKNPSKAGKPANFRLSQKAQDLLDQAAATGEVTKTQVLELCILRHALEVPALVDEARAALAEIASKNLQTHRAK